MILPVYFQVLTSNFFPDNLKDYSGPHVLILSFPKYCRYRAMMKRLEGVEDTYLKYKIVNALGGFYVKYPNTRVLFCKETFDYPELEGHELLCNHLAPKLKGRPRGKRKKRSVSPGSESNESESSLTNNYNTRVSMISFEFQVFIDKNGWTDTTEIFTCNVKRSEGFIY